MPCTSGLSTTRLVQMEFDEFYFPKLPDSRNPRSSHDAALYNMAVEASIAGQTNVSPIARTPAEGLMPLGGQWPGWTLLPAHKALLHPAPKCTTAVMKPSELLMLSLAH